MFKGKIGALFVTAALILMTPFTAYASPLDVENVNMMIEEIPEQEDLANADQATADQIREAMLKYQQLTSAEKVQVTGYDKLERSYDYCVSKGLIPDITKEEKSEEERMAEAEQASLRESNTTETEKTEYTFAISESENSVSVIVRYTTDLDGDGEGDMPSRIVITSPEGKPYNITDASPELKEKDMEIILNWLEKSLQIDMVTGPVGKWKITTSDPVAFTIMPYAGPRYEITPEEGETSEVAETEDPETPEEQEEEKDEGNTSSRFQIFIIIATLIAFAVVGKKFGMFGGGNMESGDDGEEDYEDDDEDPASAKSSKKKKNKKKPGKKSDKEYMEELKREYNSMMEEDEEEDSGQDSDKNDDADDDDDDDGDYVEYQETGNTGLLRKEDRPTDDGGGLRDDDSSFDFS